MNITQESEELKKPSKNKITRVELINHSKEGPLGRVFTLYSNKINNVETQLQDDGRTLKIFIN